MSQEDVIVDVTHFTQRSPSSSGMTGDRVISLMVLASISILALRLHDQEFPFHMSVNIAPEWNLRRFLLRIR